MRIKSERKKVDKSMNHAISYFIFGLQFSDPVSIDDPSVLCSAVAERWYLSEDVAKTPVREGQIRGILFTPKGIFISCCLARDDINTSCV